MLFTLPPLPYPAYALEPWIDRTTMEIHYGKHHAAYVENLNRAIESAPQLADKSIEQLLARQCAIVPEKIRTAVRNNGGGHLNHSIFWSIMGPAAGGRPEGNVARAIDRRFGGFGTFREVFQQVAMARFGSGWVWLVTSGSRVEIDSTANQDSPIMEGRFPILGVDVWEHAYYLKYQNRRADYLEAWWNVVDWHQVEKRWNSDRSSFQNAGAVGSFVAGVAAGAAALWVGKRLK